MISDTDDHLGDGDSNPGAASSGSRPEWMGDPPPGWKPKPNGRAGAAQASELIIGEPADNENDIPPRQYVVRRYFQRGVLVEMVGPPSAGKSLLTVAWSTALALGMEFGDFQPDKPMTVLVFNVEDDILEQQRRVAACLRLFGRTKQDLGGRLRLTTCSHTGLLLSTDLETRKLAQTALMGEVLEAVDAFKPDLIVLDPFGELHDVEENANGPLRHAAAVFRALARERNIAVLLLHHTRKGPPEYGNMDAGRGAGSVAGVIRGGFTVYEMTSAEAIEFQISRPNLFFRLDGGKAAYGRKGGTLWFERRQLELDNRDEFGNADEIVAAWPWEPPAQIVTEDKTAQLLAAVEKGCLGGQPYSARLGQYDRSIGVPMAALGLTDRSVQRKMLETLHDAGCTEQAWWKPNRTTALGLRGPNGGPSTVKWKNDPVDEPPVDEPKPSRPSKKRAKPVRKSVQKPRKPVQT